MYQIVVTKHENENSRSVLKRFSKETRSRGIVRKIRKNRFEKRTVSNNIQRKQRLRALKKTEERQRLIRLGKISDVQSRK